MDVLVEMAPGAGWLAREGDRIVFLPMAESIDTAHDVIEPLLIPRSVEDSFREMLKWIETGVPLPPMILISLESDVRVLNHGIEEVFITQPKQPTEQVEANPEPTIHELGEIANLIINDQDESASGMLVEGVVRASGLRLHFHRGWGTDTMRESNIHLPNSLLEIELGDRRVEIGNGLVLGRWPYSHPDFDDTLEPLILNDPAVSRLHAVITPTADGVSLSDSGSHNGTWVVRASGESKQVTSDAPESLASGDQIRVGDTLLRVV